MVVVDVPRLGAPFQRGAPFLVHPFCRLARMSSALDEIKELLEARGAPVRLAGEGDLERRFNAESAQRYPFAKHAPVSTGTYLLRTSPTTRRVCITRTRRWQFGSRISASNAAASES